METISLEHGSGGLLTARLVQDLVYRYFDNEYLLEAHDSACLPAPAGRLAFTTDSYVVNPLFFPGGNIGKLAVCGTVNDLSMSGARPLYLSCGLIIEAGLPASTLEAVLAAMAEAAREAGVFIVTGDTKVVESGAADKLFIHTAGIGEVAPQTDISGKKALPGDIVIASGSLGDHGLAILLKRHHLQLSSAVRSDCQPLNGLVQSMLEACPDIRVLRDPTRGGAATALNEIAGQSQVGVELYEEQVPVGREVRAACEVLGLDPLYLANEGKLLAVVPAAAAAAIVAVMRSHPAGRDGAVIGRIINQPPGRVFMRTLTGGRRIVDMMTGDPLPRIC